MTKLQLFAFAALAPIAVTLATPADAQRAVRYAATAPTSGAIVIPLGAAGDLATRAASLDANSRAAIDRAVAASGFSYGKGETVALRGIGPWSMVLLLGTGSNPSAADLNELGGIAMRETANEAGGVALLANGVGGAEGAAEMALGARLAGYRFDTYRTPARDVRAGRDAPFTLVTSADGQFTGRHAAIADGVAFARDLISEPANAIYPESFVTRTRAAFQGVRGVTIEVLDEAQMQRMGMGAILSVGVGSARPPRMLIVRYNGARTAPVVLAGKGITFDTGGTSIKPASGLWRMKGDMAGAAAVVGTVLALAKDGAPVNVIAVAALAENMPGHQATRPGDIVKAINGKTIEVLNTDAEGRMVLADAVAYAEREYKPAAIVDIATLTGAKVTAVGSDIGALFAREDALADQLLAAGEATGEEMWRLPMRDSWKGALRSSFADLQNVSEGGGAPGASYGAMFIGEFVTPATPFAHIDIAGQQFGVSGPLTPTGVDAFGVRLLERFVRDFRPVTAGGN